MKHNAMNLDQVTHTVADYILCERLNELLPEVSDELAVKRFLEQAKPVLMSWLESRDVQTAGLEDKAA